MQQGPDLAYNQSVPANWWTTSWRPSQFAYTLNTYGGNWGTGTDQTGLYANNAYCLAWYLKAQGWDFLSCCAMFGNIQGEGAFDPRKWETWGDSSDGFGLVQWTPMSQYTIPARSVWGDNDDWASMWWASGWYEIYMICAEVFGTYRTQWVKHRAGAGHNPVNLHTQVSPQPDPPYYNGEYPGERWGIPPPAYDFRLTFEEFAQGVIYDQTAPHDTVYEKLDYLTEAFYWDYEQVGDWPMNTTNYRADQTLPQRKTRAQNWYDRLSSIFNDFTGGTIQNPPYLPNADTTLQDIIDLSGGGLPKNIIALLARQNQFKAKRKIIII